jgi:ABC-type uncharacterized transport system auxiliary subunit
MTRLAALAVAIVVTLGLAGCGGKLPETRYYQLAAPKNAATSSTGAVLAIQPLEADDAYDDERIVYRLTPYRLDYYHYHRWSASPGTLVADFLERTFEHSGKFKTVTRDTTAPVTLGGRVIAIEEVDQSKTSWLGRVVVELTLTDNATGEVVWTHQYEEMEPLPAQSPEGLARALTVAMKRIADHALPRVADIAVRTARVQEDGKATSTARSARLRP